jgi:hypothetical protein
MRTSSRRKLDGALLVGGGLVVGVVALFGAAVGDDERITDMWVSAQLAPDGSAQISEAIDYNFGTVSSAGEKHGIERIVPGLDPSAPIQVSSDAPDAVTITTEAAGTKLRIGDANQTVMGRHRYTIDYPLAGVARGTQIDWEAVGTEWTVTIEHAEIHLQAPFELTDMKCFEGGVGSSNQCEIEQVAPGELVAKVDGLSAGEGVSIEGRTGSDIGAVPAAPQPPPTRDLPGSGLLPPAGAATAAALLAAAPVSWLVRRAGRERVAAGGAADAAYAGYPGAAGAPGAGQPVGEVRLDIHELEQMATTEFAPPENLSPPQGGIVLTEMVRPEHKVAWLIDAAIDGAIDLQEQGETVTGITRTGPGDAESGPLLDMAFRGRTEISLGTYDEDFSQAWGEVGQQLESWHVNSGLWDRGADTRRIAARVLGILAAIVGVVAVFGGAAASNHWGSEWVPVAAVGGVLVGAGFAAALRAWEMRVRTPAGSAAWLRVESFRRFLAGSEAYHAEEAAKRGVLREYTAWALALGEIDRWSRAVRASTAIPAEAGLSYAYLAPALMLSTMSTSTAPSSSGGGGFGGGFGGGGVGGGAGGGGGGSW